MTDCQVIVIDPTTRKATLKLGSNTVSGISKLIQIVVLSLLDTPGQDVLDPEKGAGLPSLVGQNFDAGDMNELLADVAQRVGKIEQEIIADQTGSQDPPVEKLQSLQVLDVSEAEGQIDEINVTVRLINEAGQATDIVM